MTFFKLHDADMMSSALGLAPVKKPMAIKQPLLTILIKQLTKRKATLG